MAAVDVDGAGIAGGGRSRHAAAPPGGRNSIYLLFSFVSGTDWAVWACSSLWKSLPLRWRGPHGDNRVRNTMVDQE